MDIAESDSICKSEKGLAIGLFTPNYPGVSQDGGIGTQIQNLGYGLSSIGHRVSIMTPGSGPETCDGRSSLFKFPLDTCPWPIE